MNATELLGLASIAVVAYFVVAQSHATAATAGNGQDGTGAPLAPVVSGPNVGYRASDIGGGGDFFTGQY